MRDVVIVSAVRTAIGKFGGSLSGVPVQRLGEAVIGQAMDRAGISPGVVDEVIMGNVLQAGMGQGTARQAAIYAGIPESVPAMNINNICGSGLKAVNLASSLILSGDAGVVVAGGMENMSAAPFLLDHARWGYRMGNGELTDSVIKDALTDSFHDYHMGITAENVAEKYSIGRHEQDEFAAMSQNRAEKALASNLFSDEIVPVAVKIGRETKEFAVDEYPRTGVTVEKLSGIKPAFKENGTVTAGNSSGINDGAAALVIMDVQKAAELGIKPMARIISYASVGVAPEIMGIGPVHSTRKALQKAGLVIEDINLIEANEAFAAQSIAVGKELGWDINRVNVNGGAIALGHPVGASGARILVSLVHELKRQSLEYGLATLCVGGGMGVTTIIKMI